MIGKFKTPEALWKSYQSLERAFTQKCQQIKRMEEQRMKVYELKIDWTMGDGQDVVTEIYSTEEKAKKAFNTEVVQAMQDYEVFDEQTGELTDSDYILEQGNGYWHLYQNGWWEDRHCLITLTPKEVI